MSPHLLAKQVVIFDLGGVLLREAEANLHKADSRALQELLKDKKPRRVFNRAFEFAALIYGADCKTAWILGQVSGSEIAQKIKEHIDKAEFNSFFVDQHERLLIKHGIEFILVPELLIALTHVIHEGFEFVKKCKVNGIEIAIISNWDPTSFIMLKNHLPEFFNLFDEKHIVIPHMVGKTKPSAAIYEYTVKILGVNPSDCFFVDDSLANVSGAERSGIKAVHHKNWQDTEQALIHAGLLLDN